MSLEVKGKLEKILDVQSGKSKSGSDWKKQTIIVKTEEEYNNLYAFEVFGEEKVDNLVKYNKVGDDVVVKFNVSTNEYNGRYYTSLSAWRIEKVAQASTDIGVPAGEIDDVLGDLQF